MKKRIRLAFMGDPIFAVFNVAILLTGIIGFSQEPSILALSIFPICALLILTGNPDA